MSLEPILEGAECWCRSNNITYHHKKRYNSCTDKLSKVKLGGNYPRVECNTLHSIMVKVIAVTLPPRIARLH